MTRANLQLTDYLADGQPERDDVVVVSAPLSDVLTGELDGAAAALGLTVEVLLLAALGRTIVRTIGVGVVTVDLPRQRATAVCPVELVCADPGEISASDALRAVHHSVGTLALRRMVLDLAEEAHAPTLSDVLLVLEAHQQVAEPSRLGHALEIRAYRRDGVLVLDWWYDARRFEAYTVKELAEQFSYGLVGLTSEASWPIAVGAELAMAY
jgi:hypothetical protein